MRLCEFLRNRIIKNRIISAQNSENPKLTLFYRRYLHIAARLTDETYNRYRWTLHLLPYQESAFSLPPLRSTEPSNSTIIIPIAQSYREPEMGVLNYLGFAMLERTRLIFGLWLKDSPLYEYLEYCLDSIYSKWLEGRGRCYIVQSRQNA